MKHVIALLFLLTASSAWADMNAGVQGFFADNPYTKGKLNAAVFYPTEAPLEPFTVGKLTLDATRSAKPDAGRHPLIIISHGHGGSRAGHHDTAEFLARKGYVVAAIEHKGDNYRERSSIYSRESLIGRSKEVSGLITTLLEDKAFGPLIDADRIGFIGFSAGGYTGLTLAGAEPDFERFRAYCKDNPEDAILCRFNRPPRHWPELPKLKMREGRIKAFFLMAPLAVPFSLEELATIQKPLFLAYAEDDTVLDPDENALRVLGSVKTDGVISIEGADHLVFLAPCSSAQAKARPKLCEDNERRVSVHTSMHDDMLTFFQSALTPAH